MLNIEFTLKNKCGTYPSIKQLSEENEHLKALLREEQPFIVLKDMESLDHTLKSLVLELDEKDDRNSEVIIQTLLSQLILKIARRSEERRVGKEESSRWSREQLSGKVKRSTRVQCQS